MSVRAQWKGYLKLSLVSCPIHLYTATSSNERVSFNGINRKTLNRLKQQSVDTVTGEVVEADSKAKGYKIGKEQYLLVEDAEIEELQIESSRTIEIDSFVPRVEIDPRYFDSPYYLAPEGKVGQEAFAVIRDAMLGKGMVGIGRVVLSKRERPIMLEPFGKGVRAFTLRYPYEVRGEAPYFAEIADVAVPAELLALAEQIIDSKAAAFEPSAFEDRYENALVAMLTAKQAGRPAPAPKVTSEPQNVVSLLDALKKSLKAEGAPLETAKPKAAAAPKRKRA